MEVQQVLHMNGGEGETSYAFNSSLQRAVIGMVKPIIEKTILDMCCTVFPPECLCVADLGCSSGPNTLLVVSQILDTTTKACRSLNRLSPGFQVFLNDLPGNDFNTIFKSLPDFYNKLKKQNNGGESRPNCFITGTPGSFYDRLFPDKSIHFIHSSYSLHFLSQVPRGLGAEDNGPALNNGNIYLSRTSPPSACMAYKEQFAKDFSLFLNLRSKEMIPGGRAVLTFMGRRTDDSSLDENCTPWTMLALALNDMVSEGLIEEAKLGSFNLPYYAACTQEVRDIIEGEGSFNLDSFDTFEVSWDANVVCNFDNNKIKSVISSKMDKQSRAISISNTIRSVAEALVSSHFGHGIIDDVFNRFKDRVAQLLTKEEPKYFNLVVSMTKK